MFFLFFFSFLLVGSGGDAGGVELTTLSVLSGEVVLNRFIQKICISPAQFCLASIDSRLIGPGLYFCQFRVSTYNAKKTLTFLRCMIITGRRQPTPTSQRGKGILGLNSKN